MGKRGAGTYNVFFFTFHFKQIKYNAPVQLHSRPENFLKLLNNDIILHFLKVIIISTCRAPERFKNCIRIGMKERLTTTYELQVNTRQHEILGRKIKEIRQRLAVQGKFSNSFGCVLFYPRLFVYSKSKLKFPEYKITTCTWIVSCEKL